MGKEFGSPGGAKARRKLQESIPSVRRIRFCLSPCLRALVSVPFVQWTR